MENPLAVQGLTCPTGIETALETARDVLYLITGTKLGQGEDELGETLMKSFLSSLTSIDPLPGTIILFNAGVKLACEGSRVLSALIALEKMGVLILSCGTCLDYYHLRERLCVGSVSNMYAIVNQINQASKVITL